PRFLAEGALRRLQDEDGAVVLGQGLAQQLDAAIGDRITVIVPDSNYRGGQMRPAIDRFEVVGLLNSGTELDQNLVLVRLDIAQRLGREDDSGVALRVMLEDLFSAPDTAQALWHQLSGHYQASDWTQSQGNLY